MVRDRGPADGRPVSEYVQAVKSATPGDRACNPKGFLEGERHVGCSFPNLSFRKLLTYVGVERIIGRTNTRHPDPKFVIVLLFLSLF